MKHLSRGIINGKESKDVFSFLKSEDKGKMKSVVNVLSGVEIKVGDDIVLPVYEGVRYTVIKIIENRDAKGDWSKSKIDSKGLFWSLGCQRHNVMLREGMTSKNKK